ncbi:MULTISPECIES: hypothetical protein [unclassified Pseudomonas]|uniref:hypothetical protein n=1 Tax=unclassified Pseudomonas TaxID=196821 RepID=UPI00244B8E7A|nr:MULTISPECIES: hypothetical protein [unclassified Pseudomonas]MDG9922880.1 hypothetical protein [Pseudomonas sp. GD04045]MDH0035756.1 hypothetical protein [Pseudomonas sp. GD04019]
MMRCVDQAPDQECTEGSSDFSGYINNTAICAGRNRCPDGGKPGFVGTGDDVKAVCMGGQDPNCPEGQTGGVMNGKHYCVSDPDDGHDPRCALNETPGYVGAGPNAEFTCVPDSYLPETCPPGQYVWNTGTGGFGCVTSGGEPPKTDSNGDPVKPGTVTGTIGGSEGEGGEPGEEGEPIELDFGALIEEAPKDNFQKDLEEYGQEKIDGIDIDSLIGEFDGPDGAFTERSSLDALSDFVIQHTVGSSVNCSGSMPFFGMSIGCDKMERAHRIWRWIIFVGTLIYIFKTLTRPSASGV